MPIEYDEKRDFIRMSANTTVAVRGADNDRCFKGQCMNLSATGVLFRADEHVGEGARLEISIAPTLPLTPPLHALVNVVRVTPNDDGSYNIAGAIRDFK